MAMSQIPIIRPIPTAYRDVLNTWSAMRVLIGYALFIVTALSVAEYFVPIREESAPILNRILEFVVGMAQSFFLAPIMIAVHRFIVLGEVTQRYSLDPHQPSFKAFFGWLVVLSAMNSLVNLSLQLPMSLPLPFMASGIVIVIGMIAAVVAMTRLTILFPAIAIEANGATASNAWADTKGHTFRIFLILLLAALPPAAIAIIVVLALWGLEPTGVGEGITIVLVGSILQTLVLILYVAIASRIFQALAHRLVGAAD